MDEFEVGVVQPTFKVTEASCRKVVEDSNPLPTLHEVVDEMAADEPRNPGD